MDSKEDIINETLSLANVVQLVDEEMQLYENAQALLGSSDDKFCTYFQGYMDRQALYSCKTCKNDSNRVSGICLACSLQCHDGHDLIELYTKRNFRCDCGSSLFPNGFKCKLEPNKNEINDLNKYNQNFDGMYCTCQRPYPDYEDSIEDMMIQCVICEDWFHGRHATSVDLDNIDFDEMICRTCVQNNLFLLNYIQLCKAICSNLNSSTNMDSKVNKIGSPIKDRTNGISNKIKINQTDVDIETFTHDCDSTDTIPSNLNANTVLNRTISNENSTNCSSTSGVAPTISRDALSIACVMPKDKPANFEDTYSAVFWPSGWREHLCTCRDCVRMYETLKVDFLPNLDDTLRHFESKSKSIDAIASQHMAQIDHIQKIELVQGYMDLKNNLTEYLKKFENGKVVREEDILEFFEGMQSNKKRKSE